MTADEYFCDCCDADEAIIADILEELCEKVANNIRRKVKFRPRLQRSFSCDYDEEEVCCDDVYRDYHNSLPITCVIEGCDCECKRMRVTNTANESINFNVRRASVVSFEENVETPSSEKSEFFYDAEDNLDKSRRESLYSLDEHDELDENENSTRKNNFEEEKKKGNFFKSIFTRRQKSIEEENNLKNRRKYSSTTDLPSKTLKRSSSFLKKKLNNLINNESTGFLKRSFSFRNLSDKKVEKSREKLSEIKSKEWAQSLQSLVENDNSVSYKDLSFINYDVLNNCNYEETQMRKKNNNGRIWRTQSMLVNGSLEARSPPKLIRGTSISGVSYHHPSTRLELHNPLDNNIIDQTGAVSLPSLHHLNQENGEVSPESSPAHRYRRRPQSISSEDGTRPARPRSFRSAGGGCAKLRRHNACRQKSRTLGSLPTKSLQFLRDGEAEDDNRNAAVFNIVRLFAPKDLKIAREASARLGEEAEPQEQHEWRRLVGSIRRRVQRHASGNSAGGGGGADAAAAAPPPQPPPPVVQRKNSLTQASRFEFFKREKSREDEDKAQKRTVAKQRSLRGGQQAGPSAQRKIPRLGSFKRQRKEEGARCVSRDDFLQATMRIFLVVSPPVGKMQVRSRSLNHLDTLDMRQGVPSSSDAALKDARSEPDCTRPLLAPPSTTAPSMEAVSPSRPSTPQRRHVLSRSQKSSSECFSVNFEVGDESTFDTELFFPATRGVTLHESLSKQCELRNIDLSSCDAWLSDREGNTQSWLSQSQDTACLVGRHVRITHKDSARSRPGSSQASHSRKLSGNFRPKTGGFFSSSTEEQPPATPWTPQDAKLGEFDYKKQTKQRWSGLFGNNKDTKQSMEQLIEQLNNYSKFGVPSCQVYPLGQSESTDALYKLEDDWRDIINVSELTEKQQKQQTALWELIKTEVAYIKTLKVVTDLFLACLLNLQSSGILKEIDTAKLFSNISDILEANVQFWRNSLFPLVRDMRTYRQPPCIETMCEGFLKMKDGFQAYYRFCGEQARCQHYCRENLAHNDLFTAYLAWCETQKDCNRLRLMDILVQPMQRLTKYGLLLKAILKNTDDEVERDNLGLMIRSVDDFVNNVNSSLKQKQDNERLKGIIARIESYDIVETKDDDLEKLLKSHNQLDLNKPMLNCPPERKRHLLLEGDLKLKDSSTSKMEVHCFLLTDMLLVCKASTKKGGATMRVIRQPYLVDRLVVTEINKETPTLACIYKNEFDMAVAAFLLQNNDAKKLKSWKDGIAKAQKLYAQAKSYLSDENVDPEFSFEYSLENDFHCLQLAPRSPLATSSRASRVSSLAHSHSGSVEMNDQSSLGSAKEPSRAVSIENDNRTASISSDEGVQPLPPDKSPVSQKNSFKHRLFNKTPNTLSVQPYTHGLGQSLPNLALGSPNTGTLSLSPNQNTLSVPTTSKNGHLLSPTHRGISYPPPSPTRGNLRRGLAITQSKNPPLIKTRHVTSCTAPGPPPPASFDFDVPVIAGVSSTDQCENFSRGQHRQAMMKRIYRSDNKRYHTAGVVDDIKKNDSRDASIHKRLSWNCGAIQDDKKQQDQT